MQKGRSKMKKLFITGPRAIVSAFLMRNIEKGYSPEEIKDNGENVAVMLHKDTNND